MTNAFSSTWSPAARRALAAVAAIAIVWTVRIAPARADVEKNFRTICMACHTIGAGKRVGPDLKGVTERRTKDWLRQFIRSSQTMVKKGDPTAVQLFEKFDKTPMPDPPYSAAEIDEIIAFIEKATKEGRVVTLGGAAAPTRKATPEDVRRGQEIFQGRTRLANRGPACNSCHHVKNDAVIGGGVLAKELTSVFSRIGAPGVSAVLGKPPFPVMEQAYRDRPLKEDEIFALVSFLQEADRQKAFQHPRDYGLSLFLSGSGGFATLMVLYGLFWRRRKKLSVNHDIFARQVRSQ